MRSVNWLPGFFVVPALAIAGSIACRSPEPQNAQHTVTVYVSSDRVFSEPVSRTYEQRTGVRVNAVYDTEETKSTGLANRLIAEKNKAASRRVLVERAGPNVRAQSATGADALSVTKR